MNFIRQEQCKTNLITLAFFCWFYWHELILIPLVEPENFIDSNLKVVQMLKLGDTHMAIKKDPENNWSLITLSQVQ